MTAASYTAAAARQSDAPQPFTCICCHRPTAKYRTLWLIDGAWQCSRCFLALDGRPLPDSCTHWRTR